MESPPDRKKRSGDPYKLLATAVIKQAWLDVKCNKNLGAAMFLLDAFLNKKSENIYVQMVDIKKSAIDKICRDAQSLLFDRIPELDK